MSWESAKSMAQNNGHDFNFKLWHLFLAVIGTVLAVFLSLAAFTEWFMGRLDKAYYGKDDGIRLESGLKTLSDDFKLALKEQQLTTKELTTSINQLNVNLASLKNSR